MNSERDDYIAERMERIRDYVPENEYNPTAALLLAMQGANRIGLSAEFVPQPAKE